MRALTRLVAGRSGQLLVPGALCNDLGLSQPTVKRYLGLLEEVLLIRQIPAWPRIVSARTVAAPKVAMVDSGIAANLLDLDASNLRLPAGPLGPLLEGFVAMEIARQLTGLSNAPSCTTTAPATRSKSTSSSGTGGAQSLLLM
jgi:predicted AAA+ superfamily ATPase